MNTASEAKPKVYGWLEYVYLNPWGVIVKTKLDTGAKTSSIHALEIEEFKKDDEPWVRFRLGSPIGKKEGFKKGILVERPVVREVKIKEHFGKSQKRYVVELEFCLGGKKFPLLASLADRSNFNYELLLGRRTLQNNMIVDPAKKFTVNKGCKKGKKTAD